MSENLWGIIVWCIGKNFDFLDLFENVFLSYNRLLNLDNLVFLFKTSFFILSLHNLKLYIIKIFHLIWSLHLHSLKFFEFLSSGILGFASSSCNCFSTSAITILQFCLTLLWTHLSKASNNASKLAKLNLTKAVVQLFRLQAYIPCMHGRCDLFVQITVSN